MSNHAASDAAAQRRVARNGATLLALRVLVPALSVWLVMIVARLAGADALGRYTLAFTWLYVATTLAPLGLQALLTRDGARAPAEFPNLLSHTLGLTGVVAVLVTVVMAALAATIGGDPATRTVLLVACLGVVPATIGTALEAAVVARERIEFLALGAVAENICKVGGGIAAVLAGYPIEVVVGLAVLGRVLADVVVALCLHRDGVRMRWAFEPETVRRLWRAAPTFLFISLFATLYWRIDVLMLGDLRGVADVGLYGAAYRLLELAFVVPQSLCLAAYPRLACLTPNDQRARATLGRATLRPLMALCIPAALGGVAFAEPILHLLYGAGFADAAPTLRVLLWTLLPYCWVRYHAYVLLAADRQRVDLILNVVMSALNVGLNLVLIPMWGAFGAATATLVSITLYAGAQVLCLRSLLPGAAAGLAGCTAPVLAGIAMAVVIALTQGKALWISAPAAAVTYVVTLAAGGFFAADELREMGLGRLAPSRWGK